MIKISTHTQTLKTNKMAKISKLPQCTSKVLESPPKNEKKKKLLIITSKIFNVIHEPWNNANPQQCHVACSAFVILNQFISSVIY